MRTPYYLRPVPPRRPWPSHQPKAPQIREGKTERHCTVRDWWNSVLLSGKFFRYHIPSPVEFEGDPDWPVRVSLRAARNEYLAWGGVPATVLEFGHRWRPLIAAKAGTPKAFTHKRPNTNKVMWYGNRTMHRLPDRPSFHETT